MKYLAEMGVSLSLPNIDGYCFFEMDNGENDDYKWLIALFLREVFRIYLIDTENVTNIIRNF